MLDRAAFATVGFLLVVAIIAGIAWGVQALLLVGLFAVFAIALVAFVPMAGGWWEDASRGRFKHRDNS